MDEPEYSQADGLDNQAVGNITVHGVEYTLRTVDNIASAFVRERQYGKALEWFERALDGGVKVLGMDHPDTLSTVHNMASVFYQQGQYDKALGCFGRALHGREKALGMDHPDTLSTVYNMASVFYQQGQHDKAREWFGRALDGREKSLGIHHPTTKDTVYNLYKLYRIPLEHLRLHLRLHSSLISRTTTARRADVTSMETRKRTLDDQARENKNGDKDGGEDRNKNGGEDGDKDGDEDGDDEIVTPKRRRLELVILDGWQHLYPERVAVCIQYEREYILKKENLVLHQSECVHNGVSRNGEHNGQNSANLLLDDPVKYFEGLREIEQKVSLCAGLRAIRAWSGPQTPAGASSLKMDISFELFSHESEDIIEIGCTLQWGDQTAPPTKPSSLLLQPLQGLLIGVFRAIELMRQFNFSCDQFTILVAYPERSGVIEMHSLTTLDIRLLFDIVFTEDILDLQHSEANYRHLKRFLDIFGLKIEIPFAYPFGLPSYEEAKLLLHSLTLVIQSICVGIHLYSNSHSGFLGHEELEEIQLIGLAHAPSRANVRIRPQHLACLGDMIGGPVWVFEAFNTEMPSRIDPSPAPFPKRYLLGRVSDVVDTWGAASFVYQEGLNAEDNIVQINIGGGKIQAVPTVIVAEGNHPKVAEVLCHWIPLHQSFQWPLPTTSIRTNDRVLIGMLTAQSHEYKGLIQNPRCHPHSQVGGICGTVSALGTTPGGWEMDQFQFGINGGQTVTVGMLGVWKRIPSRTLKTIMMEIWRGEGSLRLLVGKWGLEISPCTGNSRRVLLYNLLRHEGVISYIDSCLGQEWGGFRTDIVEALAFEKTEFESFCRSVDGQRRDWTLKALGRGLSILSQTGVDKKGKEIIAWHPSHEGCVPAALTISAGRSPWAGMLRESETCAVFAAIAPFCLQPDIPKLQIGPGTSSQSACLGQIVCTLLPKRRYSVLLCEIYLSPPPREDMETYQYGTHGKLTIKRDSITRFYLGKWRNTLSLPRMQLPHKASEYQLGHDSELLTPCLIGLDC